MRRGGVVDRQDLDEFQADLGRPVGQRLEVREFADAETVFAAQGKHRDRHPGGPIESGGVPAVTFVADHRPLAVGEGTGFAAPGFRRLPGSPRSPACGLKSPYLYSMRQSAGRWRLVCQTLAATSCSGTAWCQPQSPISRTLPIRQGTRPSGTAAMRSWNVWFASGGTSGLANGPRAGSTALKALVSNA